MLIANEFKIVLASLSSFSPPQHNFNHHHFNIEQQISTVIGLVFVLLSVLVDSPKGEKKTNLSLGLVISGSIFFIFGIAFGRYY
jgi:hypothetical protein